MLFMLPIAILGTFVDSADMAIQEVHIDATFRLAWLAAVREDPFLAEKIAYHPNFRRCRFNALIKSLVLNVNFARLA